MTKEAADKVKQIRERCEGICDDCGCEYVTPWFAANPLWNRVIPDRQGMLCPNCFTQRARKAGIDTSWELREETFPPPPSATTKQWLDAQPSNGRMHEHLGLYWIPYEDVPEILDRHALSQLSASEERVRGLEGAIRNVIEASVNDADCCTVCGCDATFHCSDCAIERAESLLPSPPQVIRG